MNLSRFTQTCLAAVVSFAALRCDGSGPLGPPSTALFSTPASLDELSGDHFLDHPWPSDVRRDGDGTVHVDGFPNRFRIPIIDGYVHAVKGILRGFSPAAAGYVRFDAPIDPQSLPASPPATLDASSVVQIVDIDPRSPEHGTRKLTQTHWHEAEGTLWLANTLAVAPALGHPLRPSTRYALVVTRGLRSRGGAPVVPSADMDEVLGGRAPTPRTEATRAAYASGLAELAGVGVPASSIAVVTFFTTDDPTDELFRIADHVKDQVAAPQVAATSWAAKERAATFDVVEGVYGPSPSYQQGTPPFERPEDGGGFVFDGQGSPVLQGTFNLRFALVLPNAGACPMPTAGYPVALYAHGTGGDYRSVVTERGSIGALLAGQCIATLGIDQIFHGTRPGAASPKDPDRELLTYLAFFNFNNLVAARTNNRQAAIDYVQQARLFTETHVTVPTSVTGRAAPVRFDATKILFWGHSQGGINGPLFLAADDAARGGVLSGAGSMITVALLEKTKPEPSVAELVQTLLALRSDDERAELNLMTPVINLAQMIVDPLDPLQYERHIFREPRPGHGPKSVYLSEGIAPDGTGDSYAPPHGIELGAVAMGLPRLAPGTRAVTEAAWGGLADVVAPPAGITGNLAGGKATGAMVQLTPAPKRDGHFVLFDLPAPRAQVASFCRSMVDKPVPTLGPLP